jgi:predicted nucleotidyltransferase
MDDLDFKDIVESIKSVIEPEKIILFGSYARGEQTKDSDVDLLIIEGEAFSKERSRRKETQKIHDILSRFRVPKDIVVYDKNEFEFWKDSINHIIARSLREGKILYER